MKRLNNFPPRYFYLLFLFQLKISQHLIQSKNLIFDSILIPTQFNSALNHTQKLNNQFPKRHHKSMIAKHSNFIIAQKKSKGN